MPHIPEHEEELEKSLGWLDVIANTAKTAYYKTLFTVGEKALNVTSDIPGFDSKHDMELGMRFMSGSGKPMPLFENQKMTDKYLQAVHTGLSQDEFTQWKPTTNKAINPDTGVPYADENWEWTQYRPRRLLKEAGITTGGTNPETDLYMANEDFNDAYDRLGGKSTVRRQMQPDSTYNYQIVDPWDIHKGSGVSERRRDETDNTRFMDYSYSSRSIPASYAWLADTFIPDFVDTEEKETWKQKHKFNDPVNTHTVRFARADDPNYELSDYVKNWIDNEAKPFPITGSANVKNMTQEELEEFMYGTLR